MFRILSGPLSLNERATNNIFSVWTWPSRYEPPADVEKTLKIFWVERTTRWQLKWLKPLGIPLPLLYFKANLLFPYVSTPSGATVRYTLKVGLTFRAWWQLIAWAWRPAVVVLSGFLEETCCVTFWWRAISVFTGLSMGRICLSHHVAIYACPIPRDSHYNNNMEYNSIKSIKFMKV